ncbi:MAG: hypothetical protein Kow00109_27550 [Acidobacteriota bacterium]
MADSILVSTLGLSWAVVPEAYSFTSPNRLDLWRQAEASFRREMAAVRRRYGLEPVSEIWIATTSGAETENSVQRLVKWRETLERETKQPGPRLRIWRTAGVEDLSSYEECLRMRDLIFRVVLRATEAAAGAKVFLSLAGGRKAMSADLQAAAGAFGCAALLHVVDRGRGVPAELRNAGPQVFTRPLPPEWAEWILPLVVEGARRRDPVLIARPAMVSADYPLPDAPDGRPVDADVDGRLPEEVARRLRNASSLLFNFSREVGGRYSNFRALYLQRPDALERLASERLGVDPEKESQDLAWLSRLPKVDLHCHLGGVAEPEEMLEIAAAARREVEEARRRLPEFDAWCRRIEAAVRNPSPLQALEEIRPAPRSREARTAFRRWNLSEPLAVAGALLAFQGRSDLLEQYIYGAVLDPERFRNIGFTKYEALGDLQGSGLLQSEATLRAACRVLIRKAQRHRVRYLELRCSPWNYTRGGLQPRQVVTYLVEELAKATDTRFRLIFIGSRHRDPAQIERHVELALDLLETGPAEFGRYFGGFDLAGDERLGDFEQLRRLFLPLMERCVRLTIHAGETQDAASVWKAVYQLNADRIGHGLTLVQRPELMARFLDRKIAVEMCPSSNRQIQDFCDHYALARGCEEEAAKPVYPLRKYLERGLRVTVNTDNPGISRTDWTRELLQAARLTPEGLTRWEVLRVLRCGFAAAFLPADERLQLLRNAEEEIVREALGSPL